MFSENIMLENKPFNAKMQKGGGEYLYDVIFLICGNLNQNEKYQKASRIYL